jgi:2-amino-4-hydroxy-6-hydroxymethyldihydropteridine diphosphokinase
MSPSKPARTAETAYLALGSNLGDRAGALAAAVAALRALPGTEVLAESSVYETAPVGPVPQPDYLNAAVSIRTGLGPRELLDRCLAIERDLGRVRAERWGPRTIDIDLLAYGGLRMSEPDLILPHPRIAERAFVLLPLSEIAPGLVVGGRTAADLASSADRSGVRRLASGEPGRSG